jgi:U4/U6.U5 tri-snRNP-associated protein 2
VEEKNPTIVTFPLRGLDFRECTLIPVSCKSLRPSQSLSDVDATASQPPPVYDLVANITHESVAGTTRDKENTVWKVHLRAGGAEYEKWYTIQDLIVEETRKEMIFLGESVLQVSGRCRLNCVILNASLLVDMGKEMLTSCTFRQGRW